MNNELLDIVRNDLKYIFNEWNDNVDDDTLRRNSNILRILLIDNLLLIAWRDVGFINQPIIKAPSLDKLEFFLQSERIDLKHLKIALAGGAVYKGAQAESFSFLDIQLNEKQVKKKYKLGRSEKTYKLAPYIDSRCMYVDGIPIKRSELIQYVANKLGGAHFDQSRNKEKKLEIKYSHLDEVRKTTTIIDKNAIFYELLSIGYCLKESEDIHRLVGQIDHILGN